MSSRSTRGRWRASQTGWGIAYLTFLALVVIIELVCLVEMIK